MGILSKAKTVIGDSNARELKKLRPIVEKINAWEPQIQELSDDDLRAKTEEFMDRLEDGADLDAVLPEAFAVVREAAWRWTAMRPYDVQLIGGVVLHQGKISEMRTGEGKTLVATLPVYLNALEGDGAHLITVNDYLAKRDAQWMGPIYHGLGLSVGILQHGAAFLYDPGFVHETSQEEEPDEDEELDEAERQRRAELGDLNDLRPCTRQEAYGADITYGTNNEYGFDYLRDNMVPEIERKVQRPLAFGIVDEVDNILIDEARTPLIISGQAEESLDTYRTFAGIVQGLNEGADFTADLKSRTVSLTEDGITKVEGTLGVDNLFEGDAARLTRYLDAALRAQFMYHRDRDYMVRDNKVVIVDEFTGRMMEGRRYAEGLHQAIEAKEGVKVERETVTLATITYQNYFRMYRKLAGMTGTAATEAEELSKIYSLEVIVIPTNVDIERDDKADLIFRSEKAKFGAAIDEIDDLVVAGRPVLVGTASVETSEQLSGMLKRRGIKHNVLNAKQHEREAHVIASAGEPGAVTIATNMAGRGTDIKLGQGVPEAGGLAVIGTERHESRRIDNQLRGRSGRQGDPGTSRFYVSFEDPIMKRFTPDWLPGMLNKLGMEDDQPLESGMVGKAIEQAQQKVETYHFDIRKHLVDYDDVINRQREVVYEERDKVLGGVELEATVWQMIEEAVAELTNAYAGALWDDDTAAEFWQDAAGLMPLDGLDLDAPRDVDQAIEALFEQAQRRLDDLREALGDERYEELLRALVLRTMDRLWIRHLTEMDSFRQGVGLQAYGQQDPLVAYKREAFDMFDQLIAGIRREVTTDVLRTEPAPAGTGARRPPASAMQSLRISNVRETSPDAAAAGGGTATAPTTAPATAAAPAQAPPIDPSTLSRQQRRALKRRGVLQDSSKDGAPVEAPQASGNGGGLRGKRTGTARRKAGKRKKRR